MTESAIDLPIADECAFCAYLSGRRPYTILWREAAVSVLVTREQRGVSHLLVLPNAHIVTLTELPDQDALDLMIALRDAARTIDHASGRPGISVWQNNGLAANQKIPHLHFHVAGTLPGGGTDFGPVDEISLEETQAIAARLRSAVPRRTGVGRSTTPS